VCREPEVPLRITPSNGFLASRSRRIRHRTSHRLHTRCSDGSAAPRFRGNSRLGDLGGVDSADSRHRQQVRTFSRILGRQLDCPRQAPTHRLGGCFGIPTSPADTGWGCEEAVRRSATRTGTGGGPFTQRWATARHGYVYGACAGWTVGTLNENLAQKLPDRIGWRQTSPCRGMDQDRGEGR
jgi:hypothetical protein